MMLASVYKIKKIKRIEEVKQHGKLVQSENFGISFLRRQDAEPPNFAFIVSNKISKESTRRNQIKRALNEGVRRNFKSIPKGLDFVFLAKRSIASKMTDEIMKEVDKFFLNFNDQE